MKFPYSMLRDFVDTNLSAEEVGDLLTMAGFELEGIEQVDGEPVLDVNVMSNRGDGLSVFGLSRELLAKDRNSRPTELYKQAALRFTRPDQDQAPPGVCVDIETADCTHYACRMFRDVPRGPSSAKIQKRLSQAGMRPINLLVDLTNYVLLEVGQPLHAFDLDKLAGGRIVVRKASPGEKLTTLDGIEHELSADQMMICDAEKPVAAAGIMGGLESEVTDTTRNILLESAHFVNTSVRRTRKQLGLSTEASYRFERSVDPDGVVAALNRFAILLAEVDGGKSQTPGVFDVFPTRWTVRPVPLRMSRAHLLLGMAILAEDAERYLLALGFLFEYIRPAEGSDSNEGTFMVRPPSWRPDVLREEDLIEELGRVHGYERIPEQLPAGTTTQGGPQGFELFCDRIREEAVRLGYDQIISHTLVDAHPLDDPTKPRLGPRNPASPDTALLRNSLLPSLAEAARKNGGRDLHLFEQGRVFWGTGQVAEEETRLSLLSQGASHPPSWASRELSQDDFYSLKGEIEQVLTAAGVEGELSSSSADPRLHPSKQAIVTVAGTPVGFLGQIHPDAAQESGLPEDTVLGELYLREIYKYHQSAVRLAPVSRFPAVRRDISLLIDKAVPYQSLERAIGSVVGEVLEKMWLFDVYEGKGIPEGKHSLALAMQLRKLDDTFTDEEANQVRERAVAALAGLGGTPR